MATAATETSKNYIGGEWVDATGDETFDTTNPATGETLGTFRARRSTMSTAPSRPRRRPTRAGG